MLNSIASLIISIYVSAVIYSNAFFVKQLSIGDSASQLFWNHLGIFLIILVPVFLLMKKLVSFSYSRGGMKYIRAGVLLVALVGLILSMLYHVIPVESVYNIPGTVDKVFSSDGAFTVWLILPLLALFI
jgi:hypothetical protein